MPNDLACECEHSIHYANGATGCNGSTRERDVRRTLWGSFVMCVECYTSKHMIMTIDPPNQRERARGMATAYLDVIIDALDQLAPLLEEIEDGDHLTDPRFYSNLTDLRQEFAIRFEVIAGRTHGT
tara:strand:- start:20 stop:397 length:378 start_codon:yes stop_codon:yes gene_type:complete